MATQPSAAGNEQPAEQPDQRQGPQSHGRRPGWGAYLRALGPGLISGASDNDPTTVASITVIGATTVYRLSWLMVLLYPMLAAIQIISAQIGVVTKSGLQQVVRATYGRGLGLVLLVAVVAVNLVTIGADLGAGADALSILLHVPRQVAVIPFAVVLLGILLFGSYRTVERILRYVLLVFAAYIVSAFLAHPDWGAVLHDTIVPQISFDPVYIQGALALLGTTLTSYAYVWETIEESEEGTPVTQLGLARADAGFGMFYAVAIFWFTLICAGATLGAHHIQVQTAQQAAQALAPVAGPLATDLFAIGLLASAVLAVPVLAASTAYILGQEFGWRSSLSERVWTAPLFYAAVVVTMLVAVIISFTNISPIQLLFIASIAGGLGTPISLVFLLLVARSRRIMGQYRIGKVLTTIGWATTLLITAISAYFLWQQFGGGS